VIFFCPLHPISIQACHRGQPQAPTDAQMAILSMAMSLVAKVDLHQGARIAVTKTLLLVTEIKEQPIHKRAMDSNLLVGIVATQKTMDMEILGATSASLIRQSLSILWPPRSLSLTRSMHCFCFFTSIDLSSLIGSQMSVNSIIGHVACFDLSAHLYTYSQTLVGDVDWPRRW
jgi:hypothetical protein